MRSRSRSHPVQHPHQRIMLGSVLDGIPAAHTHRCLWLCSTFIVPSYNTVVIVGLHEFSTWCIFCLPIRIFPRIGASDIRRSMGTFPSSSHACPTSICSLVIIRLMSDARGRGVVLAPAPQRCNSCRLPFSLWYNCQSLVSCRLTRTNQLAQVCSTKKSSKSQSLNRNTVSDVILLAPYSHPTNPNKNINMSIDCVGINIQTSATYT